MSLGGAFKSSEEYNHSLVQHDTFGHLFPKARYFEGKVVLASGCYQHSVVIKEEIDIEASPWWYESINDFAFKFLEDKEDESIWEVWISVKIEEVEVEVEVDIEDDIEDEEGMIEYDHTEMNINVLKERKIL